MEPVTEQQRGQRTRKGCCFGERIKEEGVPQIRDHECSSQHESFVMGSLKFIVLFSQFACMFETFHIFRIIFQVSIVLEIKRSLVNLATAESLRSGGHGNLIPANGG